MYDNRKLFFHLFSDEYSFLKRESIWCGREVGTALWNMLHCSSGKESYFLLPEDGSRGFPRNIYNIYQSPLHQIPEYSKLQIHSLINYNYYPFSVSNERKQRVTEEESCLTLSTSRFSLLLP